MLLVVGAGAVLSWPGRVGPLALLAVGGVVTMWSEAPVLGNHWLLAGLVDLALLFAVAVGVVRRRWSDATDLAERFLPVARWCLLGFYFFASFAKLNSAFFDRSVSCATFYFDESTDSLGLSALQLDGAAGLQWTVIVATAADRAVDPVALGVPPHPEPRRGRRTCLPRRAGPRQDAPVLRLLLGPGGPLRALPPVGLRCVGGRAGGVGTGPVAAPRRAGAAVGAPRARRDARARRHGGRLRAC